MIISHKHKFIFIKTRKTAGTSIEVYLSKFCGENDILTPIYPTIEPHKAKNYTGYWNPLKEIINNRGRGVWGTLITLFNKQKFHNHIAARTIKNRIPQKTWDEYFKFCVERNPWDKAISNYYRFNERMNKHVTFDKYLQLGLNEVNYPLNYPSYTNLKGEIIVDKVLKYENLTEDLEEVFRYLKIPFSGSLDIYAKSKHRIDKRPYQEFYTKYQKEKIEQIFEKEIKLHGYTF